MSVLERIRPDLKSFLPYASARRTGRSASIRLDANESPWPASAGTISLNRYPAPQPDDLVEAAASLYGVSPGQVWLGRGSDEAIDLLVRLFCRAGRDNVVTISPTFGMYRVAAQLQGVDIRVVQLDAETDFALDPQDLLDRVDDDTRIVVLCSPNNPTGTLHHHHVGALADALADRAMLLVDEAYIEFAGVPSAAQHLKRHENLAVLRTLSKAHALAGARIGALLADPQIIARVAAIAAPYPLPVMCVDAALAALAPAALATTHERIACIRRERERVRTALGGIGDIDRIWPSEANFLLVRCNDADRVFHRLLAAGILVRDVSAQPGLARCLRISVGTSEENSAVIAALSAAAPGQTSGVEAVA